MSRNFLVLLFGLGICFSACSKKTLSFKDAAMAENFAVDNVDFDYLTASSKIRFSNDDKNLSATANIRLKKDSIIWVSVTPGFGIEAARGIITRDSVIFVNRMNKEYSAFNFRELSQEFNFNIDFNLLQSVILGNMPVPPDDDDLVKKESDYFVVRQQNGPVTVSNFVDARSLKLERIIMLDRGKEEVFGKTRTRNNELVLTYSNFQQLEDQVFPFENFATLNYQRNGEKRRTEIDIQHKKANISDEALRFPFSVPEKYVQK